MIYVPSLGILQRPLPIAIWKIFAAVKRADVVNIHTPFPLAELIAAFAGKIMRKRVVITYHMDAVASLDATGIKAKMYSLSEGVYDRISLRPALSLCDMILTNSSGYIPYSRVLPDYKHKIKIVHQGISDERSSTLDSVEDFKKALFGKFSIPENARTILFIGRLVKYKGLHVLVPAFAKAVRQRDGDDVYLLLGGKGPEKEALEANCKELGIIDRVRFLGFVQNEEMCNLYRMADIVASPSISHLESTPITLLEAMVQGSCVIGSEVGGTGECVVPDEMTRIVPGGDVDALAKAILELLDVPQGKKVPRFKRRWKDVAEDYFKIFEEGSKGSP
jgi:glycosyltransferase involved in cell wall biosynthesis